MRQDFLEALLADDVERVRRLLDDSPRLIDGRVDADRSPVRQGKMTALHLAIHNRNEAMARLLLEAGAEVEARNDEGRTPLHDSIEHGLTRITELLLEHGAEMDLCAASILGDLDRMKELLDHDPGLANDRSTQLTPLAWAAYGNQVDAARELLRRGARLDDGELLCAAAVGHVEVGRALIEHGATPDRVHEPPGANALHAAARMRYTDDSTDFVRLLLDAGADPTIPTTAGKTALEIAEEGARRQAAEQTARQRRRNYEGVAALIREALEQDS